MGSQPAGGGRRRWSRRRAPMSCVSRWRAKPSDDGPARRAARRPSRDRPGLALRPSLQRIASLPEWVRPPPSCPTPPRQARQRFQSSASTCILGVRLEILERDIMRARIMSQTLLRCVSAVWLLVWVRQLLLLPTSTPRRPLAAEAATPRHEAAFLRPQPPSSLLVCWPRIVRPTRPGALRIDRLCKSTSRAAAAMIWLGAQYIYCMRARVCRSFVSS